MENKGGSIKVTIVPWDKNMTIHDFMNDKKMVQFQLLAKQMPEYSFFTVNELPIESCDMAIFFDALGYGNIEDVYKAIDCGKVQNSIYFALEPPVVADINDKEKLQLWSKIFRKVITVQSDLDGVGNIAYYSDTIDKTKYDVQSEIFVGDKKLLTSISGYKKSAIQGELYSAREQAYKYFATRFGEQFDFYGGGWDKDEFTAYGGRVATKQETLAKYRFALAYENMDNLNGYITEKVIDVLKAGVVPIYRGAKDITKYIDSNCIIFADDYVSLAELADYLENMTDEEYNARIDAIQKFVSSDKFLRFTPEYYADRIAHIIEHSSPSQLSSRACKRMLNKYFGMLRLKRKIKKIVMTFGGGHKPLIVQMSGGLGNQMFEYALYKKFLSQGKNAKMSLAFYVLNNVGEGVAVHNGYELHRIFNIQPRYSTPEEDSKAKGETRNIIIRLMRKLKMLPYRTIYERFTNIDSAFDKSVLTLEKGFLKGYWCHYKYAEDIMESLREDFNPKEVMDDKNRAIIEDMQANNSVSIHVRRGDYLNLQQIYSILTTSYYNRAIEHIRSTVKDAKFYVFSDDIEYCKSSLNLHNAVYIEHNTKDNSWKDMILMSQCKHNIIANSTFSIWATLLNTNNDPIVIAPKKFFSDPNYCYDGWKPQWVLIDNE